MAALVWDFKRGLQVSAADQKFLHWVTVHSRQELLIEERY